MRRFSCIAVCLTALVLTCSPCGAAEKLPDNIRLQELCKKFVAQNPQYEIVGLGSWIKGNYRPGHSDHDMRLVLKNASGMPADQLAAQWGDAQEKFARLAREELGGDASDLLKRTNMYAPDELMSSVDDAAGAAKLFQDYQRTPNINDVGKPVSGATATAAAGDGTFGDTKAYRQGYESQAGKSFYSDGRGKAYAGGVDLTHMAEGYGKYSITSCGNTAQTWSRLAAEAVENGDPKSAAKYLTRIRDDLKKARDLMWIGVDRKQERELTTLIKALNNPSGKMDDILPGLKSTIRRCAAQAEFFRNVDINNPRQMQLIANLMDKAQWDSSLLGKVGGFFSDSVAKGADFVQKYKILEVVDGIFTAYQTYSIAKELGGEERTWAEVLAREVPGLVSLPAGIAASLTEAVLDEAKTFGAQLVASKQEATDLIAGIFTVGGREVNLVTENIRGYTIEQLAQNISAEASLEGIVRNLAQRASYRDGGATDKKIEEEVFRCWPTILSLWKEKRREYLLEYISLANRVMNGNYRLTYAPAPATLKLKSSGGYEPLEVTVAVTGSGWGQGGLNFDVINPHMERMKTLAGFLSGDRAPMTAVGLRFTTPDGSERSWSGQKRFTFTEPGEHSVEATLSFLVSGDKMIGSESLSQYRFDESFPMSVIIEVAAESAEPKVAISGPRKVEHTLKEGETEVLHHFEASATPAGRYRLQWVFGDGTSGTAGSPEPESVIRRDHRYKAGKTYTASVRMLDDFGAVLARDSIQVAVNAAAPPPPTPESKPEPKPVAAPEKIPPAKAKPEEKKAEFVWVLTDIVRYTQPNTSKKEDANHHTYTNSGTSFTHKVIATQASSHSIHDGHYDDVIGEYFAAAAEFSTPPGMIEGGDVVTLTIRIAPTGRKRDCLYWNAYASAHIDRPGIAPGGITRSAARFTIKDPTTGKSKGEVRCGNGRGGPYKPDSGDFTATMRKGGRKAGEQRSIYLEAMYQRTEYLYTWTPRSEAKVGNIEPKEKMQ